MATCDPERRELKGSDGELVIRANQEAVTLSVPLLQEDKGAGGAVTGTGSMFMAL